MDPDPDLLGTAFIWLPWIRIRIGFNADPDPGFYLNVDPDTDPECGSDPGAWQLSKIYKYLQINLVLCLSKRLLCTFVGMFFFLSITYFMYFSCKNSTFLFLKSLIRIRIYLEPHSFGCLGFGSVLGMRIRIQEHGICKIYKPCFVKAFVPS